MQNFSSLWRNNGTIYCKAFWIGYNFIKRYISQTSVLAKKKSVFGASLKIDPFFNKLASYYYSMQNCTLINVNLKKQIHFVVVVVFIFKKDFGKCEFFKEFQLLIRLLLSNIYNKIIQYALVHFRILCILTFLEYSINYPLVCKCWGLCWNKKWITYCCFFFLFCCLLFFICQFMQSLYIINIIHILDNTNMHLNNNI